MSCSGFTVDKDRTVVPINFSDLGEKLLYPHGQPRGMLALVDHHPVAEDRVCNCEVAPEVVADPDGVADSSKSAESSPEEEAMDTAEKELPKLGNEALLKKFGSSCKLENLITMVSNGYSKPLLSQRLSGVEAKEGLCITVYLKHLVDTPGLSLPPNLPESLLDISEQVLSDRLTYLKLKSMRKTKAEKAGGEMKLHAGVSKGMKKRKLSADPKEDGLAPPPAKNPKIFSHTVAEMVKIMGQFVQATTNAGSDKKLNAHKTMESILARNELAKKNLVEVQITGPEAAPAAPATAEPPVEEIRVTEPIRPPKVPRGKGNLRSIRGKTPARPMKFLTPPPPLGNTEVRGRSGSREGRGGSNNMTSRAGSTERPNPSEVSFDEPIRCTNSQFGRFCGTYNFMEAPFCKGCGIAYPNGLPRELHNQRPRGGSGWQGGMGRSRHWKWGGN